MNKTVFNYNADEDIYTSGDCVPYADGSESFFINLFASNAVDEDGLKLKAYIKDWPTRYHLSPKRANVLAPFRQLFKDGGHALEIGAGMGAVTTWLAKNFAKVDCVEGDAQRAKALRLRAKHKKNVEVFVGDAKDTNLFSGSYDLATLIGVLEYIPCHSCLPREESVVSFLEGIKDTLAADGILVIAIENKLGLKYFSGCTEDHNSKMFSGIMDYPEQSAVTFGRNELESLIKKARFKNVQFYHPFPDYKLPSSVYRECEDIYELNSDFLWPEQIADNVPRAHLFHEPLAVQSLFKERTLHHFSNSFIVLCSPSEEVNLKTDWLFHKTNNFDFIPAYHHTVEITRREDGFKVKRTPIVYAKCPPPSSNSVTMRLEDADYVKGSPVLVEAYRAIFAKDNFESFLNLAFELKDELLKHSLCKDEDGYDLVDGSFLDFAFWNLVRRDGELVYIDKKWNAGRLLPVDYILFRNIFNLYRRCGGYRPYEDESEFLVLMFRNLFPNVDQKRVDDIFNLHNIIDESIFGSNIGTKG